MSVSRRAGRVVCCDVSREWTDIAKKYWSLGSVSKKIVLKLAPALQTLKKLKGPFDFAFIDADKENLQAYFERCLRLVRRGGLVAIDNTLWHGTIVDARDRSVDARAVRAFNRKLRNDRRVEIALGNKFREQPYHDFIISEGLLPLDLLEEAVMTRFVPSQR